MQTYIQNSLPELLQLIRQLCAIPAPSHFEDRRAIFIRDWMVENGFPDVEIDEAKNVVSHWGTGAPTVFLAHTDTVFPDMEPMPFREADGRFYCPGVTDDTAQLAVLLICARYFLNRKPKGKIVIAANSCEEGLGNLKGSKALAARYPDMAAMVAVDHHNLHEIITNAVGSRRYRVTIRTEGGHSFTKFGSPNAIHHLAMLVDRLYRIQVPVDGESKTTYNVGQISGGTSVNTIAQEAWMLYEYRSDSRFCMEQMERLFWQEIAVLDPLVEVEVEEIGFRPCAGNVDPVRQQALLELVTAAYESALGVTPAQKAGSTDCNTALAAGIPAVCIGAAIGGGTHTREEYLTLSSLEPACRLLLNVLERFFEEC